MTREQQPLWLTPEQRRREDIRDRLFWVRATLCWNKTQHKHNRPYGSGRICARCGVGFIGTLSR